MFALKNLAARLGGVAIAVFLAVPALAQAKKDDPQPPWDVPGLPNEKVWIPWVLAFVFFAGVVALAFKNPHRTHQD
jgi:hypothetical protein